MNQTQRQSQITFRSDHLQDPILVSNQIGITKAQSRLTSLDILRGLTIFGMAIVDTQGPNPPWFIRHFEWQGISTADLIFPSFLFILGMAVPFAITQKKPFGKKTVFRIIALFLIGVIINLYDEKFTWLRIPGILQRMSICYLLVSFIHCITKYGQRSKRIYGALVAIIISIIYLSFMLSYQNLDRGCPKELNLTKKCNFGGYFDEMILSDKLMDNYCDPEGIFTSLSAFINSYFGYVFSLILFDMKGNTKGILIQWTIISVLLGSVVYPLTLLMPFIKKLWTISYVFVTSAITGLSLVLITYLVDILAKKYEKAGKIINKVVNPFIWLGLNPLLIYIPMQFLQFTVDVYIFINGKSLKIHIYETVFLSWMKNQAVASAAMGVFYGIFWTFVAWIFYRKKIFFRL